MPGVSGKCPIKVSAADGLKRSSRSWTRRATHRRSLPISSLQSWGLSIPKSLEAVPRCCRSRAIFWYYNAMQPGLFGTGTAVVTQRKRTQGGVATSQAVLSAHMGDNSDVFPIVLALHV